MRAPTRSGSAMFPRHSSDRGRGTWGACLQRAAALGLKAVLSLMLDCHALLNHLNCATRQLNAFIRAKYEQGLYKDKTRQPPDGKAAQGAGAASAPPQAQLTSAAAPPPPLPRKPLPTVPAVPNAAATWDAFAEPDAPAAQPRRVDGLGAGGRPSASAASNAALLDLFSAPAASTLPQPRTQPAYQPSQDFLFGEGSGGYQSYQSGGYQSGGALGGAAGQSMTGMMAGMQLDHSSVPQPGMFAVPPPPQAGRPVVRPNTTGRPDFSV